MVRNPNAYETEQDIVDFEKFLRLSSEDYDNQPYPINSVRSRIFRRVYEEFKLMSREEKINVMKRDTSNLKLRVTEDDIVRDVTRCFRSSVRFYVMHKESGTLNV